MSFLINPYIGGNVVPTWVSVWSRSSTPANSTGWNANNLRVVVPTSVLATNNGTQVRLTLVASTAAGFSIDGLYCGHKAGAGDAYDFDGTQVQCLVSGSGSISVSANGSVVTDPVNYAFNHTKDFTIAAHFNATSAIRNWNTTGATSYFKAAADETATANVSGYSQASFPIYLITKIEALWP